MRHLRRRRTGLSALRAHRCRPLTDDRQTAEPVRVVGIEPVISGSIRPTTGSFGRGKRYDLAAEAVWDTYVETLNGQDEGRWRACHNGYTDSNDAVTVPRRYRYEQNRIHWKEVTIQSFKSTFPIVAVLNEWRTSALAMDTIGL